MWDLVERSASGTRLEGLSWFLLRKSNQFEHGFAYIAPLGRRKCADLIRVQGT